MNKSKFANYLAAVKARYEAALLPISQKDAACLMRAYRTDAKVLAKMVEAMLDTEVNLVQVPSNWIKERLGALVPEKKERVT